MMDTIFALATARGKAGVAVVRLSGPLALDIGAEICGPLTIGKPSLRVVRDRDGSEIDQALILSFAEGASFTGEDVVEFHLHGSPSVVSAMLQRLEVFPGSRLAQPGEFTRRALENERLDLSQVEGLSDLIEAETETQRRQALQLMRGGLTEQVEGWRADLIRAAALIEATIDFADEEVPTDVMPEVLELSAGVCAELTKEIAGTEVAERVRDGFEVAILGPPNIGKSTLLNALAGRDAAITSEIAGTTRDVIEVRMDLRGIPVTVLDTAGLRETSDVVENIGIQRAQERANQADIRVFLTDDHGVQNLGIAMQADDLVLKGKMDTATGHLVGVSGKTGAGVDAVIDHIGSVLEQKVSGIGSAVRHRHGVGMRDAVNYISAAHALIDIEGDSELVALELRSSLAALDSIIGRVGVEDLLDEIFASFCLGK